MFTCALDPNSRMTLCDQLYAALRAEIERGGLPAGSRMPSKRELAAHLHVSTATVEAAYARLTSEGICESRPRSGIYVLARPETAAAPQRDGPVPVRWDFGTGAADAAHFPYATWARLMREVLSEQSRALLLSGDPQGSDGLRREIAGMLHRLRGVEARPEAIVLGAGTEVLVTALAGLIGREKLFAVEDPGYSRVRRILVASGARIAPTPLCAGAIDVRALYTSGAGAVYVTPTHQFPTGEEMNPAQRAALLRFARETGAYILEDDYDSEFRFTGANRPALHAMDGGEHVIYMNTFARTLASGLRMSFMVLPHSLIGRYREMHAACSVPGFEQETLRKFIAGGYLERHIARMRVVYRARLQALEQGVRELGLGEVAPCSAGLYALLRVGGRTPAQELLPLAARAGVRLTRLCDYGVMEMDAGSERVMLLGFAGMDETAIGEGLRALKQAWM
ncbi:MAG TPA: PLP-dependent aminotransferase family protein [Candidatus Ventricola intestinavium]|nr:PLP-dependent aminotransferase family protein [Candidatus Ventricola intestinavium]